jgi:uncharacterized protein YdiU (UPF0061 family)
MYTGYLVRFDHSFAKDLADLASPVEILPLINPKLVTVNRPLLGQLNIPTEQFSEHQLFEDLFTPQGKYNQYSIAQKYGGHQFGHWNPDLGDGRGLLIAEVVSDKEERWDLHLKGAGKTPYSRFGDGRAVLRSTIREYLASEALHHLGIPTSRALCLIASDETVYRERAENGAMMIRTCQSHIRFGHFEYFYHSGQHDKLQRLFDYSFKHHFVECQQSDNPYLEMLTNIVKSTAKLIAHWQAFGFNHGVMNTDNMSIHGITFDFGPFAFLDDFQPNFICNHSDDAGRYAFDKQPGVALWNLNALAHPFTLHLSVEQIKQALGEYEPALQNQYSTLMLNKLGLTLGSDDDQDILNNWLGLLIKDKRDYTNSFRLLCEYTPQYSDNLILDHFVDRQAASVWLQTYKQRLLTHQESNQQRQTRMKAHNPKYILRNYLAQQAIENAEKGDFSDFNQLLRVLEQPFEDNPEFEEYASPPPEWGKALEISCSS